MTRLFEFTLSEHTYKCKFKLTCKSTLFTILRIMLQPCFLYHPSAIKLILLTLKDIAEATCYLHHCIKCLLQIHLNTEELLQLGFGRVSLTYLSKFFSFVSFPGLPKVCQELLFDVSPVEFQLTRSPPIYLVLLVSTANQNRY